MNKAQFIYELEQALTGLPQQDIVERLNFYSEMIDDRMEDGLSEEEAVFAIGSAQEIAKQTVADIPLTKLVKEKITHKKKTKVWEIILLILGSPIWVSLGLAAISVIFSLYAVLWAVIIALWAVAMAVAGAGFGEVVAGVGFAFSGNVPQGLAMIGAGVFCAGLSVFLFYGCKAATKGVLILTKKFVLWIKKRFIKREEV